MTTYKVFFKLIKSRIGSIALYFVIFAVLTMILSSPSSNEQTHFEESELAVTIIDRDNSTLSKALTAHIDNSQELVGVEDNKEAWTDALFIRDTEYILIIPEGFEADTLAGNTDLLSNYKLPGSTAGTFIDMQVDEYMKTLTTFIDLGASLDKAIESTSDAFSVSGEVTLTGTEKMSTYEQPAHYYFFQYLPYIFICMVINGLGPVLMTFRKSEIKKRVDCSSTPLTSRNIMIIVSSIAFSLLLWVLFMLLGVTQYSEFVLTKDYLLLTLISLMYMVMSLAMTYLTIHFVKNENVLNMVSNIFGLGSSFLCGIFVPQELLGESVLAVGQFLPPYWYLDAMHNVTDGNMSGYCVDMFILIGYTLAFLAIALAASKQTARARS